MTNQKSQDTQNKDSPKTNQPYSEKNKKQDKSQSQSKGKTSQKNRGPYSK